MRVATACLNAGIGVCNLCHSAFVRVATGYAKNRRRLTNLCHSAFVRVATPHPFPRQCTDLPLPQRIRAGCDVSPFCRSRAAKFFATAHSCGLRLIAVIMPSIICALPQRIRAGCDAANRDINSIVHLCHSAFVRVATRQIVT